MLIYVADLEDLLHRIAEGGGENVRCARVLTMLASKACRKSVMIGDPLDLAQMRKVGWPKKCYNCSCFNFKPFQIVGHMSELNQPWVGSIQAIN
jgi:DNA mismatch repair protein PMS2